MPTLNHVRPERTAVSAVLSADPSPFGSTTPGSSIHGIFQARVLEWGAVAFSEPYLKWPLITDAGVAVQILQIPEQDHTELCLPVLQVCPGGGNQSYFYQTLGKRRVECWAQKLL